MFRVKGDMSYYAIPYVIPFNWHGPSNNGDNNISAILLFHYQVKEPPWVLSSYAINARKLEHFYDPLLRDDSY